MEILHSLVLAIREARSSKIEFLVFEIPHFIYNEMMQ